VPDDALVLYRPVGQEELDLIAESGFRAFPPRLPGQPVFYGSPACSVGEVNAVAG
jgi:hypothetical protein